MGLQQGKVYQNTDSLRYGSLMIMADQVRSFIILFSSASDPTRLTFVLPYSQDHDGSHIKGLIINFLDYWFPSLLKLPQFLLEFITPIVKVRILQLSLFPGLRCSLRFAARLRKARKRSPSLPFPSTKLGRKRIWMEKGGRLNISRSVSFAWRRCVLKCAHRCKSRDWGRVPLPTRKSILVTCVNIDCRSNPLPRRNASSSTWLSIKKKLTTEKNGFEASWFVFSSSRLYRCC